MWEEVVPFLNPVYNALISQLFHQRGETAVSEHNTRPIRIAEQIRNVGGG